MASSTLQAAQIFKERCEDSPGILVLCQGDWRPTAERIQLFEEQNYYVMTAANGYQDITDWLPQPRCIGAMFAHPETVAQARQSYPDKVIERFEGVGARFLRTLTQELPYGLHNAGQPFTATAPPALKTVDVVSVFSPVALKRGHLLIESLLEAQATAYLFAQSLGANPELLASFLGAVRSAGKQIEYIHYPFDPYALVRIDGRIVIDGRPIGANNSVVSAYLARARLMVHTSTTEGISNSVMEALLSDVPVLVCDDIRGPLQALSQQLPACFSRAAPNATALADSIQALLRQERTPGAVRAAFRATIDPFEINRKMVRGSQEWFTRHGLPWKGHCLGLLGGVQSQLDLATVTAEESYRGGRHIYPSAAEAVQCASVQIQIAQSLGRTEHVASLQTEIQHLQQGCHPLPAEASAPSAGSAQQELARYAAMLAEHAPLKHVLMVGTHAGGLADLLVQHLEKNSHQPQLHCIEISLARHAAFAQQYSHKPFVHAYHGSTVPLDAFATESDVRQFYSTTPGKLKDYPIEAILQWLHGDQREMASEELEKDAIRTLKAALDIQTFDMVILDGREFTGFSEFQKVHDSKILILPCTETLKNHQSAQLLSGDPQYKLRFNAPDISNGLSIFLKIK